MNEVKQYKFEGDSFLCKLSEDEEETYILDCIRKDGGRAYKSIKADNLPITTVVGNNVYKTYPDGSREMVTMLKKGRHKLLQRTFSLKDEK